MFKQEKKYYKKSFLVAFLMAFVLFAPFVAADRGMFVFYGDYNAQQIPFFKHCVEMVHNGTMGWDWQTDLGANFFGSYTYYTLGSPFFWFMTLFPAEFSPYLMAPLLCLKFALFSLFGFIYIRRFVTRPQSALIGGILYAFSGFNLYNVFFQFQDAMIWFPLLLIGLEEAVMNKRRGMFALAVAINCLANYFFFIQDCIFLVLYFVFRYATDKNFSVRVRDFLCLAFESVVGVMIASVLFMPSIYQVLDVPRSTNILKDWSFLFFGDEQRYGLLLEGIFLPPEVSARNEMFQKANAKWSSVALYLPLFSMAGVLAFFKNVKNHWVKPLLLTCLLFAFVPGLNASFTMFNNNYYTRWFYMPELICCLATAYVLEHKEHDLKFGATGVLIATSLIGGLALLAPFTKETKNADGTKTTSLVPRFMLIDYYPLWIALGLAAASLIALFLLLRYRKKASLHDFFRRAGVLTVVFSMLLGFYFIGVGREIGPYNGKYNNSMNARFTIDDPDFYRIEGIDETNNVNMLWDMSSLKSFTSIIPGSTFRFYELMDISRSVNSAPDLDRYGVRAFARVKYIMVPVNTVNKDSDLQKLMIYEYMETQGDYEIYKTDYALPMGFAYDNYYLETEVKDNRKVDNLMVRAAVITKEQAEKYSDVLKPLDPVTLGKISSEEFKKDALNRISEGVKQFSINKKGFTAVSNYDAEKLVCFSVPWCKGWSATVNGESVEIDKVNGGMCAIRVPAGECSISFTYETPMLKLGMLTSAAGIGLWGLYMLIICVIMKRRATPYVHLYESDQAPFVKAHVSYIDKLSEQITSSPERGGLAVGDKPEKMIFPEIEEDIMNREESPASERTPDSAAGTERLTEEAPEEAEDKTE